MTPSDHPSDPGRPGGGDPSMEDILASIRRILSEDEAEAAAEPQGAPEPSVQPLRERAAAPPDVLPLDESMLVQEPVAAHPPAPPPLAPAPTRPAMMEPAVPQAAPPAPPAAPVPLAERSDPAPLLAPETAAAASSSVGSLLRTIASERGAAVRSGGPTIEDLVREELRPLLKDWLDAHLPSLVERLVRLEIERVVGRALS